MKPAPLRLRRRVQLLSTMLAVALAGSGCAISHPPSAPRDDAGSVAQLTALTAASRDLQQLPPPKGRIAVAVYGIRDQTGQYKPSPDSSFSTVVTQGASSLLVKALKDSGWFVPVERENLQNLLTERKIVRALEMPQPADAPPVLIPPLLAASVLIEGGIVAYESNVRTGGAGARFLGIGMSAQYRVDQVTVNLRTVDIRSGQILQSVSTTKTIYAYELHPSVFKFVNVKDLVELEAGLTRNEPAQLCVSEAIASALGHLIVQGIRDQQWVLADPAQWSAPVVQRYAAALPAPAPTSPAAAPPTSPQRFTP
ncbi:curli production assembly/transport protein CsgG [Duganella sp. Leaf126]|uniref:CsgG/HfaB family protein n=1 Tax=Duganella sp. Leaf126 TaxID=1736266 RepID=UPI0006FADAB1|nr:CsgG/HfaB family protein [Duganella sp. Leaf126]KQQ36166.1 curli production assembly/transport protein CsgG [Duganella sp. Leaf126]